MINEKQKMKITYIIVIIKKFNGQNLKNSTVISHYKIYYLLQNVHHVTIHFVKYSN